MKPCTKCNKDIPGWVKIDGKNRNLKNRKLCLSCSPFGLHNTKRDPTLPTLTRKQISEKHRLASILRNKQRRNKRKEKLIALKGGKCITCGYNKCLRVMSFHHRNPKLKLFPLDQRTIASKPWKEITKEAKKCDLLCLNCHMELEEVVAQGFEP